MSPRVPALKARKVIRTFQNAGYTLDHIEGSHYYFTHPTDRAVHFSVPHHSGEMRRSTLKQAKLTLAEFLQHDP